MAAGNFPVNALQQEARYAVSGKTSQPTPMTATVRKAKGSDVSAIAKLARDLAFRPDETGPTDNGFLVSGFTEADYSRFVATAEHFLVCVDGDRDTITGFLLAYGPHLIDPANAVESSLESVCVDDFVLIKQIAVDPQHQRRGVGTRLYRFLIGRVPNTPLFAAIVLAPPNPASVRFHERLGFRNLSDVEADDGRPRSIWHRPIQGGDSENSQ